MSGKDLNIVGYQYNYPKLFIKPPNGDEIDAETITSGLHFLDDDSDPILTTTYTTDTGADGSVYSTSQISKNVINARFYLTYGDWYDYKMKKHEIAQFFMQKGLYRIRSDAEPGIVKYVRAGNFTIKNPEDRSHVVQFTIPFENPSGVKWSLPYSDDLMTYDQNLWQYGMNLPNGIDLNTTLLMNIILRFGMLVILRLIQHNGMVLKLLSRGRPGSLIWLTKPQVMR